MFKKFLIGISFILLLASCKEDHNTNKQHKDLAVQFFRDVYGGESSKTDSMISDDIVVSYPIFEQIYGKKAIRGRKAFQNFTKHFAETWKDARITIHDTIAEGNQVVVLWSFSGRKVNAGPQLDSTSGQQQNWGGITLYRFNESGKITAEIGEESFPGPFERWASGDSTNMN